MGTDIRHTPLHDVHTRLGAKFTDFAGWQMPLRYTGDVAEHTAVRSCAGLFDLTHMGEIVLSGPQAGQALDYALVGHASAIGVGRARYTMICADDGGILDDLIVYRTGEQEYLVVANASNAALVAGELVDRAEDFDTEVRDASADYALIAVQGPKATGILAPLTPTDLATVKYYASYPTTVAGRPALLARTGYTGEDGFELFVAPGDAEAVWAAVAASDDIIPCGLSCRDTLRLEAGMPLYGNELTAELTPYAAGLGRVVKLDKPSDFVGRAALAKASAETPARKLVGLVTESRRSPRHGYPVVDPADGARIGEITSGAPSPTLGHPVAMAYVDADRAVPGSALAVDIRGTITPVDVVELPFYRRSS
ncbi:glycine cleavage system aminomethyltransferase GcvT [Kutzneria buriramensis]|uniref:Aminomethyltransferase n=1 Tax=Kutzneria buriramensis TaxID=1045776 RepID=A0A3E0IAB2_9PSEU|nr:glycine cleavage system aminomethyltransferase GcvT [Kutzneria buriramensis]REH55610.1 aminomethyltransferase [Kutzneria buriramensis]